MRAPSGSTPAQAVTVAMPGVGEVSVLTAWPLPSVIADGLPRLPRLVLKLIVSPAIGVIQLLNVAVRSTVETPSAT